MTYPDEHSPYVSQTTLNNPSAPVANPLAEYYSNAFIAMVLIAVIILITIFYTAVVKKNENFLNASKRSDRAVDNTDLEEQIDKLNRQQNINMSKTM